MGLQGRSDCMYLSIGYGRIRRKCKPEDKGAVERTTQKGEKTYAIEYTNLTGILENILFRDDPQYGKSWTLQIVDGKDKFSLQIPEDSRYATDLLKKVPNLHKGTIYKFTPYDFETEGKRKVGFSIKDGEVSVDNYYQKFTKDGQGWKVENLHGYPDFRGDSKDKDELKIYFLQVTKFLRNQALKYVDGQDFSTVPPELPSEGVEEDDGLPF